MKAVVILGSRNPKGQTAAAVDNLVEGMTKKGIGIEKFYLPVMKFERCRQCEDNGWGICRSEGRCTIPDDFESTVDKIRQADVAVFATPVYYSDLSESTRTFLERLRRICMNEAGQTGIKGKIAACIAVAGGGGGGSPMCLVNMERMLGGCGFNILDVIPVRRQNADLKATVLKITGEWIADHIPGRQ